MSTLYLVLRLTLALAFVGGLLWFVTRAGKKGRLGFLLGNDDHAGLDIAAQRPLGRTSSIAVVRAGRRHLLIGVSEHGIALLAEGDDLVASPDIAVSDELESRRGGREAVETMAITEAEFLAAAGGGHASTAAGGGHASATTGAGDAPSPHVPPRQEAPKRLPAMFTPTQPRMTLIESLRELTVRKL